MAFLESRLVSTSCGKMYYPNRGVCASESNGKAKVSRVSFVLGRSSERDIIIKTASHEYGRIEWAALWCWFCHYLSQLGGKVGIKIGIAFIVPLLQEFRHAISNGIEYLARGAILLETRNGKVLIEKADERVSAIPKAGMLLLLNYMMFVSSKCFINYLFFLLRMPSYSEIYIVFFFTFNA